MSHWRARVRAIEIASPITDYDVVEIRGLMDLSGYEM